MKKIILIIILISLFNLISCIQNEKPSLIGKWKLISINTGDFYFNAKTDSIHVSKEFKEMFSDSLELDDIIKTIRITKTNNIINFSEDGIFTVKIKPKTNMHGTYRTKPLDKKIKVTFKGDTNIEMDYEFIDNLLHLTTTLYDKKSKSIFEKIVDFE